MGRPPLRVLSARPRWSGGASRADRLPARRPHDRLPLPGPRDEAEPPARWEEASKHSAALRIVNLKSICCQGLWIYLDVQHCAGYEMFIKV